MQFDSWQAFFAMGGHAVYVWLAYGATVAVIVANFVAVRIAIKRMHRELSWVGVDPATADDADSDEEVRL